MAANNSLSSSSLRCELQVIGAKNVETKHKGSLFVRCYLPAGNNSKIQLNTREVIHAKKEADHLLWDDTFSLECNGTEDSAIELQEQNIVLELRWRKAKPLFGKINGGSQLLARAEMPWKSTFDAPNMEIQKWVPLTVNMTDDHIASRVLKLEDGVKPPAVQIAIKVEVIPASPISVEEMKRSKRRERSKQCEEYCGCKSTVGCCSCADTDLLFVAMTLEAF